MSPGTAHAGTVQHVEHAGGATVVEHGDGGRQPVVEQGLGSGRAVVLGQPTGQQPDLAVEAVASHGLVVAAAAVGGSGCAAAVDVGDPAMPEGDEVVDSLAQPLVVGRPNDVEIPVAGRARHDHDGKAGGELGERRGRRVRAEQDECLAAVLHEACDGPLLVTSRG